MQLTRSKSQRKSDSDNAVLGELLLSREGRNFRPFFICVIAVLCRRQTKDKLDSPQPQQSPISKHRALNSLTV